MSAAPQIRTELMQNLRELHLPAMRECFEQAAQESERKETLSYEQYCAAVDAAGVRVSTAQPHRCTITRVGSTTREDDAQLRPEAFTR